MNDKSFESLPEEKRKRIINACIKEFALNGYENASTNVIVKNAGISKGTLFYYFESKKNLFMYMFNYSAEYLIGKYLSNRSEQPSDLFDRLVWISMQKIKMVYQNPMMSRLTFKAIADMPKELEKDLTEKYNELYTKYLPIIFSDGVDTSKFRKGVDSDKAIEIMMFCLDGVSHKFIKAYSKGKADEVFNDLEELVEEFNKYVEILKYGIYGKR